MNGAERHGRPAVCDHVVPNCVWTSESARERDLLRSGTKMMDPCALLPVGGADRQQLSRTEARDAIERDGRAAKCRRRCDQRPLRRGHDDRQLRRQVPLGFDGRGDCVGGGAQRRTRDPGTTDQGKRAIARGCDRHADAIGPAVHGHRRRLFPFFVNRKAHRDRRPSLGDGKPLVDGDQVGAAAVGDRSTVHSVPTITPGSVRTWSTGVLFSG